MNTEVKITYAIRCKCYGTDARVSDYDSALKMFKKYVKDNPELEFTFHEITTATMEKNITHELTNQTA